MTLLAEKLKNAGYDTFEATFVKLCFDALQRHPDSVIDAWRDVGANFGYEYLRGRMKDMQGTVPQKEKQSPQTPLSHPPIVTTATPYKPAWKPEPKKHSGLALKVVKKIMFNRVDSKGIDWARFSRFEETGVMRDNAVVLAVREKYGPPKNENERNMTYGELMSPQEFIKLYAEAMR